MMKQASGNNMGVIARRGGHQKRPTAHNFVADKRHQHRMFNVVVERVAVADTVKCKPGKRWNEFCQTGLGRAEPAVQLLGEVGAQRLRREFRYGNQRNLPNFWTLVTINVTPPGSLIARTSTARLGNHVCSIVEND